MFFEIEIINNLIIYSLIKESHMNLKVHPEMNENAWSAATTADARRSDPRRSTYLQRSNK